jgi:hypothetical protein
MHHTTGSSNSNSNSNNNNTSNSCPKICCYDVFQLCGPSHCYTGCGWNDPFMVVTQLSLSSLLLLSLLLLLLSMSLFVFVVVVAVWLSGNWLFGRLVLCIASSSDAPAANIWFVIVRFTKISLFTIVVNSKNNSKTSSKQQKRKLIEEKCYWNQPYVPIVNSVNNNSSSTTRWCFKQSKTGK